MSTFDPYTGRAVVISGDSTSTWQPPFSTIEQADNYNTALSQVPSI